MADLWFPWCSSGDEDCCGGVSGHGSCFACGDCYDVPSGGAGGPLQWMITVPTTGVGNCFGASCLPATGVHYLDYVANCTWRSPSFTLCSTPGCYAWTLSLNPLSYPACDPNPVDYSTIWLSLGNVCSGTPPISTWLNECPARVKESDGTPCAGGPGFPCRCEPAFTVSCNDPMTLIGDPIAFAINCGWITFPGGIPTDTRPPIDVEPVWT